MKSQQTTKQDILEAINEFSDRVDERFKNIESIMVTKDELKTEFAKFETRMVSKDYLDQKLSDLRGDLIEAIRGEDKKIVATVDLLTVKNVFSKEEANKVLVLGPVI